MAKHTPLAFLLMPLIISPALADNAKYHFNLPAQPLAATLDSVAGSANTKLIYADATVKGKTAAPVQGDYTAQQALAIALGDSGLNYQVVDKTLITVSGQTTANVKLATMKAPKRQVMSPLIYWWVSSGKSVIPD